MTVLTFLYLLQLSSHIVMMASCWEELPPKEPTYKVKHVFTCEHGKLSYYEKE